LPETKSEQVTEENRETFFKRLEGRFSQEEIEDMNLPYRLNTIQVQPVEYHTGSTCMVL